MAVAPHALAAQSSLAVLREGGNAIEAMVAAAATIASTAVPPSRSTAIADCAASACGATAMPRDPRVGWLKPCSSRFGVATPDSKLRPLLFHTREIPS